MKFKYPLHKLINIIKNNKLHLPFSTYSQLFTS